MTIEARFDLRRGDFHLHVDLALASRGLTAVFGPSGSGKTTLLRAIAGLERVPHGTLRIGNDVWQSSNRFVPTHQRAIGYVFQEPSLFAHLDVRRNIEYGRRRSAHGGQAIAIDRAIELLDLGRLLARRPLNLSGGEQQRVAIARALATSPRLLLLDEPLAALDDARKREILPYLESLHRELEIPVLYVSHSRHEVARLADHLVLLDRGRVTATGAVSEIFARIDLPLAHGPDAETVIDATVAGHDDAYGLARLDFAGGRFLVASAPLPVGTRVRLQVQARDVSVTLTKQADTSILNIFPVTVDQVVAAGPAQVTVRLMAGTVPILSRITRKSARELGLKTGDAVHAQIKSVALLG